MKLQKGTLPPFFQPLTSMKELCNFLQVSIISYLLGSIFFFSYIFNILSLRASLIVRERVSLQSKSRIINKILERKLEKRDSERTIVIISRI